MTDPDGDWDPAWSELYTETGAGTLLPDDHPNAEARKAADESILTNLPRLNLQRA